MTDSVTSNPRIWDGWLHLRDGVEVAGRWVDERDHQREISRLQREVERLDADCCLLKCERDMFKAQRADWKAVADSRAGVPPAEPHVIKQIEHALEDCVKLIDKGVADYIRGCISDYRHSLTKEPVLSAGCHRSHPHEDMSAECERLTVIARENNRRAHETGGSRP